MIGRKYLVLQNKGLASIQMVRVDKAATAATCPCLEMCVHPSAAVCRGKTETMILQLQCCKSTEFTIVSDAVEELLSCLWP